jgi:drug/metabolite transporter (DMT)-like permease
MQHTPATTRPNPCFLWSLAGIGIIAISFASILIRLADAPSLAIATYRVALATLILTPYVLLKNPAARPRWNRQLVGVTCLSGFCLALHFAFWIRSLQMTSVASSATLVSTTPCFVALFATFFLGERLSRHAGIGLLLVLTGSALIAGNDYHFSKGALLGDLLAVAGALAASGYLLAGRFARRYLDLATYTLGAYGSAALLLLAFSLFSATPLSGFSTQTYLMFLLLAAIPQLIGHTTFNWTLKFLSPTTVAVLILGEPIGASLLAYWFFGEALTPAKALGLFLLGAGIVLSAATSPSPAPRRAPPITHPCPGRCDAETRRGGEGMTGRGVDFRDRRRDQGAGGNPQGLCVEVDRLRENK